MLCSLRYAHLLGFQAQEFLRPGHIVVVDIMYRTFRRQISWSFQDHYIAELIIVIPYWQEALFCMPSDIYLYSPPAT